jgi:hypothetical protein
LEGTADVNSPGDEAESYHEENNGNQKEEQNGGCLDHVFTSQDFPPKQLSGLRSSKSGM